MLELALRRSLVLAKDHSARKVVANSRYKMSKITFPQSITSSADVTLPLLRLCYLWPVTFTGTASILFYRVHSLGTNYGILILNHFPASMIESFSFVIFSSRYLDQETTDFIWLILPWEKSWGIFLMCGSATLLHTISWERNKLSIL